MCDPQTHFDTSTSFCALDTWRPASASQLRTPLSPFIWLKSATCPQSGSHMAWTRDVSPRRDHVRRTPIADSAFPAPPIPRWLGANVCWPGQNGKNTWLVHALDQWEHLICVLTCHALLTLITFSLSGRWLGLLGKAI